jgi:hypothetical protein
MSALAGTISAPFAAGTGSIGIWRWLRPALSLLLAVGILAVALSVAFGSGASAGVDPVQVFSSGPLLSARTSGGAQLSIDGIVPGQSRTAEIRLSNAGSGVSAFSLAAHVTDRIGKGGTPLSSALMLRIAPATGGPALYAGTLAGLQRLDLGRIAAGAGRAYDFSVRLPRGVGNGVEGSALSASFSWNAS